MTGDDSMDPTIMGVTSMTGTRLRALLLAALESPTEDGTHLDGAAGASQVLAALGRRVGLQGEGLLEDAMAPTASVPDLAKAEGREDREAALLLYLVATAAALARYGIAISSKPAEDQRERYESLATRHAGFALGDLFRRAADRIHKGHSSS